MAREVFEDPEVQAARERWTEGGSALPVVELLAAKGAKIEAATYARLALAKPDCLDADKLKAVLDGLSSPPAGWDDALATFARAPSDEGWQDLLRFIPTDALYLRMRDVVGRLLKLKLDADTIFRYVSRVGLVPDLIMLVEEGRVSVRMLEERADQSSNAKTTYFGLAAQAAFLAGDMLGTVRLLRQSRAYENEWCSTYPHMAFVRERATHEQAEMLDRAGIPPLE